MAKVNLSQSFIFRGKPYGPDLTEIPDDVFNFPALSPAFKQALHPELAVETDAPAPADESEDDGDDLDDVSGVGVAGKANRKKATKHL